MTRVTKYKLWYVVAFLALLGAVGSYLLVARPNLGVVVALCIALLLPGRVQGLLFRDLFRGRRALDRGDPKSALGHLNAFLATVRAQPWRRWLLWLSWSFYTPNVEAMTMNNIGAARFNLDDIDAAEAAWRAALELDSLYPIPHANLALVAATRNDSSEASQHLETARELGYSGSGFDRIAHRAQSILANVESHGPAV